MPRRICWVDGRLLPLDGPAIRADDSAFSEGRGCYTSVRIEGGHARFADRHVARLQRAARELRLGELAAGSVLCALRELAAAAFGEGDGVVRLQISRDGARELHLVGVARPLGAEPTEWRAITIDFPHAGGSGGHKTTSRLTLALAADALEATGVDEGLLFDAEGRLVEGVRSNLFVADAGGALCAPPLARGAVAGVARAVALERLPEVVERDLRRAEVRGARELVAVNAVRGARPITTLDDRPVGDGRPGPCARRLAEALADDLPCGAAKGGQP